MTTELLARAKQGDRQAISALINQTFQPKGITAKVAINQTCLQIALESANPINQAAVMAYLHKNLEGLQVPSFKTLSVLSRRVGATQADWVAKAMLKVAEPIEQPALEPQVDEAVEPAEVATEATPEPSNQPAKVAIIPTQKVANKPATQVKPPTFSTGSLALITGVVTLFTLPLFPLLVVPVSIASWLTYQAVKNRGAKREEAFRLWSISFLWSWGACMGALAALSITLTMNRKPSTQIAQQPTSPRSESSESNGGHSDNATAAYNLAYIDGDSSLETYYASVLDQLESRCREERGMIADMTVTAVDAIAKGGKKTSNYVVLKSAVAATEDIKEDGYRCAEAFALVIVAVQSP